MARLSDESAKKLLQLPESGMGYQIILDHQMMFIVFNAELIFDLKPFLKNGDLVNKEMPRSQDYTHLVKPELIFSDFMLKIDGIQSDPFRQLKLNRAQVLHISKEQEATNITAISFYRFSAFRKDRRVDSNGNFLAGTYASTFNDLKFVPSGFSAVGRYALPNSNPAKYINQIVTNDQPTLIGTATPNFGQSGGGVEVFFSAQANAVVSSFEIDES